MIVGIKKIAKARTMNPRSGGVKGYHYNNYT